MMTQRLTQRESLILKTNWEEIAFSKEAFSKKAPIKKTLSTKVPLKEGAHHEKNEAAAGSNPAQPDGLREGGLPDACDGILLQVGSFSCKIRSRSLLFILRYSKFDKDQGGGGRRL